MLVSPSWQERHSGHSAMLGHGQRASFLSREGQMSVLLQHATDFRGKQCSIVTRQAVECGSEYALSPPPVLQGRHW